MRVSVIALAVFAAVLCAFSANAMTVCPYIDSVYLWNDDGTLKIKKGIDFAIEIQMDNPDIIYGRSTISLPLTFYGIEGCSNWLLVNKGGEIIPNIVMTNGFEYHPYPNPWFDILDTLYVWSWDGNLSDTVCFTGSGIAGMPFGAPLETRLEFWFRIDEQGTFCVDSSYATIGPCSKCGWLFDPPYPNFYGPHCWEVGEPSSYMCGDANFDQSINLLDITYLINALYRNGMQPFPIGAGDNNADGEMNLLDVTNLVNFIYKDGPELVCL